MRFVTVNCDRVATVFYTVYTEISESTETFDLT
jgi:hypothetical protein